MEVNFAFKNFVVMDFIGFSELLYLKITGYGPDFK